MTTFSTPLPLNTANASAVAAKISNHKTAESAGVSAPYDRDALARSIVHIGVGGFHRSHLATYIDEVAKSGNTEWSIVGSGVLPGDAAMEKALREQDYLYCLIVRDAGETSVEIISSIVDYLAAYDDPNLLVEQIAASSTEIVSLTVTEGGYPIDDATGNFDADSPNCQPGSAFGMLVAGLERRRVTTGMPVTVLSCDNIMSNGAAARKSILGTIGQDNPELTAWVGENVGFPNSMVDRITPATTDSDRTWLQTTYGLHDAWPVVAEPFRQWVLEDNFAGARPPLESLDIIVTADVEPYEFMKLRLLNAGHSCIAYLGAIAGYAMVDEAVGDAAIRRYLSALLHNEAKPVLPAVEGIDVNVYIDDLINRFSNPAIGDQIQRLCLDGSAKFPKFLIPTVEAQIEAGGSVELSALALASWCHYLGGSNEAGLPITPAPDPQLDTLLDLATAAADDPGVFLTFGAVFTQTLVGSPRFTDAFVENLRRLQCDGVAAAISAATAAAG